MNRYKLFLIVGLMTLALVFVVVALRSSKTVAPVAVSPSAREISTDVISNAKPGVKRNPVAKVAEKSESKKKTLATGVPITEATVRRQSVEAWEKQIDDVIARTNVPVRDQSRRVKEAFDKLDKEDQLDGIRHGLNLLPDERFAVLYDVLYDKGEDSEVLDAIFSDALNRPEAIKMPILKALRKDREHPLFFESARILDVIESAEATQ